MTVNLVKLADWVQQDKETRRDGSFVSLRHHEYEAREDFAHFSNLQSTTIRLSRCPSDVYRFTGDLPDIINLLWVVQWDGENAFKLVPGWEQTPQPASPRIAHGDKISKQLELQLHMYEKIFHIFQYC